MALRRWKIFYFGFITIVTSLFFSPPLNAGTAPQLYDKTPLDHDWRRNEFQEILSQRHSADEWKAGALAGTNPRIFQEIDALHYAIDAHFYPGVPPYPNNAYLTATATITAKAKSVALNQVVIDFNNNITINYFLLNGIPFSNYTRSDNKIWMDLSPDPLQPGEQFEVSIDYSHIYGADYQGLLFRKHGTTNTPAICSIDQPYESPGWWPCFDYPSDKATADVYITCPDWMIGVGNGLLQPGYPIDNLDGTKTFYWKENYQMYTSVLSVAMTDYVTWQDTYISPLDGRQMPLLYYAFPEDASKAMIDFTINNDALSYYALTFGEYPFIDEKYGIAETPNPYGSMEHQTITSLTYKATKKTPNWDVIVHELAHQWWGDWVTCDTWNHIWLNEGFSTYAEVLYHEYSTGEPAGPFISVNYDDGLYAGRLDGTVYNEDISNPWSELDEVYDKGAWVLHMLRHMMGDTSFTAALKAYGQAHAYSTATTDDFKNVAEAYYGSSLTDYFNQWVYTPYRPIYSITYEKYSGAGCYKVDISLNQTQSHWVQDSSGAPIRDFYTMPVDFTFHYTDQTTQTFTVKNNSKNQSFQIITLKEPDHVVFDEDSNILKVKSETFTDKGIGDFICEPTVIQLSSFTAERGRGKVILEWTTESEIDNAGFNLYRSQLENSEYVKINPSLIPAKGIGTSGATYTYVDSDVKNHRTYYYKLEDVSIDGVITLHGPVSSTPGRVKR